MKLADHTAHYRRDAEEFDYFAPRSGADLDAARRIQQAVLHALPSRVLRAGARVLDLGSGDGWLLRESEAAPDPAMVVSCDLGVENLRKLRRAFPHAALVAAHADRLPFREGAFDAAVASEVLEHLNEPGATVAGLLGVLTEGGRLVVTTPYRETLRYSLCIHCNQPTPVNAHLHSFDEHALRVFFDAAGFEAVRHFTFQNKLLVFLRVSLLLRFLPWRLWSVIDRLCNFAYKKPHSVLMTGDRPDTNAS